MTVSYLLLADLHAQEIAARIEDELSKKYAVPVTIHDRSWIVKEIIENDRRDLAFNYLKVGKEVLDNSRLGPKDYSRSQQLADIEEGIADPEAYQGMEIQRVTDALVAAKLSRGLELPRHETDGRFDRAIRLATAHGTFRQQLETLYEKIWTAYWWYDDFEFLKASYAAFEKEALKSDHAKNVEFLGNLHQLLINSVVHGHMTRDECQLDDRSAKLRAALEAIEQNYDRPNNSLHAKTDLMRIRLNEAMLDNDQEALAAVWKGYSEIIDKASGLGEYDADTLARLIEVAGQVAGNDPTYTNVVEKLAEFIGTRKSEGEGALILLRRAQKLGFEDHFDMIRLVGKAAIGLTKREYSDELIEAVNLLALAYRSADLSWASRASVVLAAATIIIQAEEDSDLSVSIVPTINLWAWVSLELGYVPDFLSAVQLLNGCLSGLPLDEASQEKLRDDLINLDAGLGCFILNLDATELRRLARLPDILGVLGLFMARTALLYTLGYEDVLRDDGSLPDSESASTVAQTLSILKSQREPGDLPKRLVLNETGAQSRETIILGMRVEVEFHEEDSLLLAELVLGTLEAFFATVLEREIVPHAELFRITIDQNDSVVEPAIETSDLDLMSKITWPRTMPVSQFHAQPKVREFLCVVAGNVMGATCVVKNSDNLLEGLFADEAVLQRMTMVAAAQNSYSRLTSRFFTNLTEWNAHVKNEYPLREKRPDIPRVTLAKNDGEKPSGFDPKKAEMFQPKKHKGMSVRSVIDVHAWDQAEWKGCMYLSFGSDQPPAIALTFLNAAPAKKIFERWQERFGRKDANDEIIVSIIRQLPDENPHHYCVQIAPGMPSKTGDSVRAPVSMSTRSLTMTPESSRNLDMFLEMYEKFGVFFILPGILSAEGNGEPELFIDLAILKRGLSVKFAKDVGEHDIEALALRIRGLMAAS